MYTFMLSTINTKINIELYNKQTNKQTLFILQV